MPCRAHQKKLPRSTGGVWQALNSVYAKDIAEFVWTRRCLGGSNFIDLEAYTQFRGEGSVSTFAVHDSKCVESIVQVYIRVGNRRLPSIVIGSNVTCRLRMVEYILNIDTEGDTLSFHEFNVLACGQI